MADLTERTRVVLGHLAADPYGDHTVASVCAATGLPAPQVYSVFGLLQAQGWIVGRHLSGPAKAFTLTTIGRGEATERIEAGDVGVPLAQVDREDPALADRVRAIAGLPLRHA